MSLTTATCPACRGSGFLPIYKLHRGHTGTILATAKECHVCDGRGEIRGQILLDAGLHRHCTELFLTNEQALLYALTINEEGHQPNILK